MPEFGTIATSDLHNEYGSGVFGGHTINDGVNSCLTDGEFNDLNSLNIIMDLETEINQIISDLKDMMEQVQAIISLIEQKSGNLLDRMNRVQNVLANFPR